MLVHKLRIDMKAGILYIYIYSTCSSGVSSNRIMVAPNVLLHKIIKNHYRKVEVPEDNEREKLLGKRREIILFSEHPFDNCHVRCKSRA